MVQAKPSVFQSNNSQWDLHNQKMITLTKTSSTNSGLEIMLVWGTNLWNFLLWELKSAETFTDFVTKTKQGKDLSYF